DIKLPRSSGADLRRKAKVMEKWEAVDVVHWQSLPVVCYATQFWQKHALSFATIEEVCGNRKLR
ncbi:MAG: hypothetical protein WKF77_30905, partial [Planctomycetaceae bacterium]